MSDKSHQVRLNKLLLKQNNEFSFTEQDEWLGTVLDELTGDVGGSSDSGLNHSLKVGLTVRKFEDFHYKNVVTVEGQIEAAYPALCSQSGTQIQEGLKISVNAVFIDSHFEEDDGLGDEITLFYDESERDLYYFEKNLIDFLPVIHEYIFLNRNPYPGSDHGGESE